MLFFWTVQIAAVEQDVVTNTETLVTTRSEIKELKSTLQRLQIDLQSNLSMVCQQINTSNEDSLYPHTYE